MNKNMIFLSAVGVALVLALLSTAFSDETDHHRGISVQFDSDDDHYSGHSNSDSLNGSVEFNGKRYKCDAETGKVELTHEDGSVTVVTCD